MPIIRMDCSQIRDWSSFHSVFARELGFPSFYGRNMDAWIDCMSSIGSQGEGMTTVRCNVGESLTLLLDHADAMPKEIAAELSECASIVNERRINACERAVIELSAWPVRGADLEREKDSPVASRPIAIAAGANLGDAAASINSAFTAIAHSAMIASPRLSPLYSTAPVRVGPDGPDPGGDYVNAAIVAESSAPPLFLLALLHSIERSGGRQREGVTSHGAPRPIDLDLLLVGDLTLDTPDLTLPHPRMHQRAFVLIPLADIAPDLHVPCHNTTVAQLLARLGPLDARAVRRITS